MDAQRRRTVVALLPTASCGLRSRPKACCRSPHRPLHRLRGWPISSLRPSGPCSRTNDARCARSSAAPRSRPTQLRSNLIQVRCGDGSPPAPCPRSSLLRRRGGTHAGRGALRELSVMRVVVRSAPSLPGHTPPRPARSEGRRRRGEAGARCGRGLTGCASIRAATSGPLLWAVSKRRGERDAINALARCGREPHSGAS